MSTQVTAPPEDGAKPRPSAPRRLFSWMISGNTFTVTVLAFFSALVVGAVIIVLATPSAMTAWHYALVSPGTALSESWDAITSAYGALLSGALGSRQAISETLVSTTPLLMAGLGVALAFRAGLFNIGGEGQLILGAMGATWAGFSFRGLPILVHLPLALLAGAVAGGAWAFIPGILKARTGAHEVITSMMLNYVALNLLGWVLIQKEFCATNPCTDAISKVVAQGSRLPHIAGSNLRVNLGIVLAVLFAIGVAWLLQRSTLGFEFRMIGLNADAAGVAGVSTKRLYVVVMTMSGMLVGLAGAFSVLGVDYQLSPAYGGTTGFDAITVAILGHGSPLGVALASLLFGAFISGGRAMQVSTGIPLQLVVVIQAVLVLFVAAPGVIRTIYRIKVRRGAERVFGGWG
ncbi:MAG TPA: ABC transporter permease [Actinomycetota bacterium]|nr:ABC transporter permease [Actinomycetota bacterium]